MMELSSITWKEQAPLWNQWYRVTHDPFMGPEDQPSSFLYIGCNQYPIHTLKRMLADGRKTMARNEHTYAVPMCFVAMQHFPEAMTDDEKMVLISLWEKAADSGPLTLPHFEDRSLIDEAFADHRWHRAILRVVETKNTLDGYHDCDNG